MSPANQSSTVTFRLSRDSLQAHEPDQRISRFRRRGYQRWVLLRNQVNLLYLWEKRWLLIALLVGFGFMHLPTPEGLSVAGQTVLAMSLMATIMFITEPVPLPAVALMIVLGQIVLLGVDSTTVAKSLMTDSVLFIMGALMLAVAVVKQRLDKRIAWVIVQITGTSTFWICFGISTICGLLASFIGEHTVAAMMLPVGVTLINLTSSDPKKVRKLAIVLLLSISYGCAIASIGTPSGGARNAIMIGYWQEFFYKPGDPETRKFIVHYLTWMAFAYPLFLVQLPIVTSILFFTFKPEFTDMSRAVARLRAQIMMEGPLKPSSWAAIFLFCLTIVGWIWFSETLGLGTVAIAGALAFLVAGLVRWEDINAGVNWGVVLLYAAAISLGVQMKQTGAAQWMAESFINLLAPFGAQHGIGLYVAVGLLTTAITNTMTAGAAVAVLGPIMLNMASVSGSDPIIVGFITAMASSIAYVTAAAHPAFTIVYASGYIKSSEFVRVGVRMTLVSLIALFAFAVFIWPLLE